MTEAECLDWELREALRLRDPIAFKAGTDKLDKDTETLSPIARILQNYSAEQVSITGHTSEDNEELSKKRAEAVAKKLKQMGCTNKFHTEGWSCSHHEIGAWNGAIVCAAPETCIADTELSEALKEPIKFVPDSPELHKTQTKAVEEIGHILRKYPSVHIRVHGHSSEDLLDLTQARSDNVIKKLKNLRCENKMIAVGWSDIHPKVGRWMGVVVKSMRHPNIREMFEVWPCKTAFAGEVAEEVPCGKYEDGRKLLEKCRDGGFGGFVVKDGKALFKRKSGEECKSQMVEDKEAVLYVLMRPR